MPLRPTVYSPQLWIIREKVALNWKWGGPGVIHQGCKLQFSLGALMLLSLHFKMKGSLAFRNAN